YQVDRKNQGAAASTVNWELSTLSKIFNTLMEIQYVDANPARMVKRLSTREEEREVYLGFSDVNAMVELCPPWVRPIVLTGYYTGMRRGEVLGLTWKQVNLSTRVVRLGPQDTKEGRRKRVPLRLEVIEILERSRRVRSQATGRVFLIDGRPPNKESIKNPWRKSCQALDLLDPRPRFHDLRHTWRANARRSGVDPVIAETILGHWHRQRSVNERYGRISDVEMLKAVDSMVFDNGMTEIIVDNKRRQ
ncbi:MAG TPA: site-specific integrase, partial [Desulfomonilaceae bacterium]|nr:site-specific integrase [Desulfomonilaceae bacterium]